MVTTNVKVTYLCADHFNKEDLLTTYNGYNDLEERKYIVYLFIRSTIQVINFFYIIQ